MRREPSAEPLHPGVHEEDLPCLGARKIRFSEIRGVCLAFRLGFPLNQSMLAHLHGGLAKNLCFSTGPCTCCTCISSSKAYFQPGNHVSPKPRETSGKSGVTPRWVDPSHVKWWLSFCSSLKTTNQRHHTQITYPYGCSCPVSSRKHITNASNYPDCSPRLRPELGMVADNLVWGGPATYVARLCENASTNCIQAHEDVHQTER